MSGDGNPIDIYRQQIINPILFLIGYNIVYVVALYWKIFDNIINKSFRLYSYLDTVTDCGSMHPLFWDYYQKLILSRNHIA